MGIYREFNPLMIEKGWHMIPSNYESQWVLQNGPTAWAEYKIRHIEAVEWCKGIMVHGRFSHRYHYGHQQFFFKGPQDALRFKLAWGGDPC